MSSNTNPVVPSTPAADPAAGEKTVSASFKIGWHGCEFEATVSVPSEPVSPRRLLPMVQKLTNALVGMSENLVREAGETISCQAGCGACCRQLVPVSESEARNLRDLVAAMPEPRQSQVRDRFAKTRADLDAGGMLHRLLKPNEHTRDVDLGIDYYRTGVPCPFLEEESCSIHPDRPIVCREYLVMSPAELCSSPTPETIRRVPVPGHFMTSFAKLDGPAKLAVRWVPLPLALEWADAHPEPPAAIPGPRLFGTFMNALLGGEQVPPPGQLFTPKPGAES